MSLDIKLVPVHDANNNPHDSLVDVNDKKDYKIFVNGKSYCDYTNVIINILVLDPILDAVLIHDGTPKPIPHTYKYTYRFDFHTTWYSKYI